MTICNSLLSLLFSVLFDSTKELGGCVYSRWEFWDIEIVSVSVKGQKTYWELRVGFCQGPISIVGWTLGIKRKVYLLEWWEQASLCITAGPEKIQICVKISKKPLQMAETTLRSLFLLYKPARETGYDVSSTPSRQNLLSMMEGHF